MKELDTYQKFVKLLQFVKSIYDNNHHSEAPCIKCEAEDLLSEIGEE